MAPSGAAAAAGETPQQAASGETSQQAAEMPTEQAMPAEGAPAAVPGVQAGQGRGFGFLPLPEAFIAGQRDAESMGLARPEQPEEGVSAAAAVGTLDAYLYGENLASSASPYGGERIRFASRCSTGRGGKERQGGAAWVTGGAMKAMYGLVMVARHM